MNFELSKEHLAIQETARTFATNELLPGVVERDEAGEFSMDLFHKMGDLGLIGLPYPEEVGGQGGDYLGYAMAVEEISKVDVSLLPRKTATAIS